jgi:hypothetical protein
MIIHANITPLGKAELSKVAIISLGFSLYTFRNANSTGSIAMFAISENYIS